MSQATRAFASVSSNGPHPHTGGWHRPRAQVSTLARRTADLRTCGQTSGSRPRVPFATATAERHGILSPPPADAAPLSR
eukprot:779811-Prymnesium_polylepis.1